MPKIFKISLVCLSLSVMSVYAQDLGNLGSSSDIFRRKESRRIKEPKKQSNTEQNSKKSISNRANIASKQSRSQTKSTLKKLSLRTTSRQISYSNESRLNTVKANTTYTNKSTFSQSSLPKPIVITTGGYEKLIEQANKARDDRNYSLAEELYRRATQIRPNDARGFYGLGNVFTDQQRWEQAEIFYRKAIELDPQNLEAHIALSFILTQPVNGLNLSERYIEAEKFAKRAIEISPNSSFAYDLLGLALELRGIINAETESAYRKAIELDPNFALPYAHLARFLYRKGEKEEAKKMHAKALQSASDTPTMILIAEVLQSQQKYQESEQLLRLVLKTDPQNPFALFLLGRALTVRNQFNEAENLLTQSINSNPNNFSAYLQLAIVYTKKRNYALAEEMLRKASDIALANEKRRLAIEFESLGDKLLEEGRKQDAIRLYSRALEILPDEKRFSAKIEKAKLL